MALDIPNTGMAVITDIGETDNIHPKNKQDVGKRLAQWAFAKTYGLDVVPSGPLYERMEIDHGKALIHFKHIGKGLIIGKKEGLKPTEEIVIDAKLERFAIAGKDKVWVWANAVIDGDTVVVSHPDIPVPVAVRYAYSANPLGANLYNRRVSGLALSHGRLVNSLDPKLQRHENFTNRKVGRHHSVRDHPCPHERPGGKEGKAHMGRRIQR